MGRCVGERASYGDRGIRFQSLAIASRRVFKVIGIEETGKEVIIVWADYLVRMVSGESQMKS